MTEDLPDPDPGACRAARRLCRLFRIERAGGFARRPAATVQRVVERRGALIDALLTAFEHRRPAVPSLALLQALAELADEVRHAREFAEVRIARLRAELGLRHGAGRPTGLRGGADGQLLGRG